MTPRQLLQILSHLDPDTLDNFDLSVKVNDEYYPVTNLVLTTDDQDSLDPGSPVLLTEIT
jgi:hypothetical protein